MSEKFRPKRTNVCIPTFSSLLETTPCRPPVSPPHCSGVSWVPFLVRPAAGVEVGPAFTCYSEFPSLVLLLPSDEPRVPLVSGVVRYRSRSVTDGTSLDMGPLVGPGSAVRETVGGSGGGPLFSSTRQSDLMTYERTARCPSRVPTPSTRTSKPS